MSSSSSNATSTALSAMSYVAASQSREASERLLHKSCTDRYVAADCEKVCSSVSRTEGRRVTFWTSEYRVHDQNTCTGASSDYVTEGMSNASIALIILAVAACAVAIWYFHRDN